jgi:hypothetical protein
VSGDYLWDGSGEPDPEIRRLEEALRPLRGTRPPPQWGPRRLRLGLPGGWGALAAAAAVLLALAAVTRTRGPSSGGVAPGGWEIAWLEGASWRQARVVRESRLGVGEWVDTRERRARLSIGEIGEARLEPSTRVGRLDRGERSHHLSLARGVMHAVVWAPPGQLLVDTPSAVAVDLGCSYTLEVEEDGSGLLRVETGWVGFESRGLQSLVPAGAACPTRRGVGPGTPYFETAPEALRRALLEVDFGPEGGARQAALELALAAARERDALSLWHLLSRVEGVDRGRVFDRLATLVPAPAEVTREGILRGDPVQRDLWWDQLGLGSADFWRDWTARWRDPKPGGPPEALPAR